MHADVIKDQQFFRTVLMAHFDTALTLDKKKKKKDYETTKKSSISCNHWI